MLESKPAYPSVCFVCGILAGMDAEYRNVLLTLLFSLDQGLADTEAILSSPVLIDMGKLAGVRIGTQELRELLFKVRGNVEEELERAQRAKH